MTVDTRMNTGVFEPGRGHGSARTHPWILAMALAISTAACSASDTTQLQMEGDGGADAGDHDAGDAHPRDGGDGGAAPIEPTPRCVSYYEQQPAPRTSNAARWCREGAVMTWQSADWPSPIELFYHCEGEPSAPAVYLQHGWPTSGFDFQDLSAALSSDFFVCALDTPGYGFSDKPDGYPYSILEDGEIVQTFIEEVMEAGEVLLLTHDKGDSVGLELLHRYVNGSTSFVLNGHVMLNGSIQLEQAAISPFQTSLPMWDFSP